MIFFAAELTLFFCCMVWVMGCRQSLEVEEEATCRICWQAKKDLTMPYQCKGVQHAYCRECYLSWCRFEMQQQPFLSCPTCRRRLKQESYEDIELLKLALNVRQQLIKQDEMARVYNVDILNGENKVSHVRVFDQHTPHKQYNMFDLMSRWSHLDNDCVKAHGYFNAIGQGHRINLVCLECFKTQNLPV